MGFETEPYRCLQKFHIFHTKLVKNHKKLKKRLIIGGI